MSQPTPYTPSADFSGDELANVGGRSTIRTAALDTELQGIATNLDGLNANIELIQRDDGELRDGITKLHTLAPEVKSLLAAGQGLPRGAWLTATVYALRDIVTQGGSSYIAAVAHTSGTFATDLADARWLLLALGAAPAASGVSFTPTTNISASNVQAAIQELDAEARALNSALVADLASTAAGKGAALVAVSERVSYPDGSTGAWLRKTSRAFNASAHATGGTGTAADPYTGWQSVFPLLPSGALLNFEGAVYSHNGQILHNKSIVIQGQGASTVLRFTGISGGSVPLGLGGLVFNGTPRPGYPGTVYNMGTGAVAAGQRAFTFASVSGLAVGDDVYLALGVDPTDGGQSFLRMFNRVESIVSNTVTFNQAVPEAVAAFPGSPAYAFAPTFNECVKFTNGVCDFVAVRDLAITTDAGPAFDRCLFIGRARNVAVDGLTLPDVLNGPYFGECENIVIGSINAARVRGDFFGAYGSRSLLAQSLTCESLVGVGFQLESQMRHSRVGLLKMRGASGKTTSPYVQYIGNCQASSIETLQLSAVSGVPNAAALSVIEGSQLRVEDAVIENGINNMTLKRSVGTIRFGGRSYMRRRDFRVVVNLTKNMSLATVDLPNGLLCRLRGSISDTTGVTIIRLKNSTTFRDLIDSSNTINFFPAAGAFGEITTDDFVKIGTDTSSYAFNSDPTGHQLQISTGAGATEGAVLVLEGEVMVLADDGVKGAQDLGTKANLCGAKTLNFAAPGAVPGSPADQTITVTGAAIGDRVSVSAPVTIAAGYILQAFVSAPDTVSVRWTQFSGAAADPDGAGGVYRVDVWK
jgi:hypothetical protein